MSKREYQLLLPYYKQGDDMSAAKRTAINDVQACELHILRLDEAVKILKRLQTLCRDGVARITDADTHVVMVEVDEELGAALVSEGFLHSWPEEDEEFDEISEV